MAQCEVCGNEYDKAFQVSMPGGQAHTFDAPWWPEAGRWTSGWDARGVPTRMSMSPSSEPTRSTFTRPSVGGNFTTPHPITGLCLTTATAGSRCHCTGCGFAQRPTPPGCASALNTLLIDGTQRTLRGIRLAAPVEQALAARVSAFGLGKVASIA